jgi:hypothetical protein
MKTIILSALVFIQSMSFAQTLFYTQTGNGTLTLVNGEPSQFKTSEWLVRLYRRGEATSGYGYWGTIKANSYDEVIDKLKKSQEFELHFNSFIGKGPVEDETFTHFNPSKPIAELEIEKQNISDVFSSIHTESSNAWVGIKYEKLLEKANTYYQAYKELNNNVKIIFKGKTITSFDNTGSVFKEYVDNLKNTFTQISNLKNKLPMSQTKRTNSEWDSWINDMMKNIDKLDNKLEHSGTIVPLHQKPSHIAVSTDESSNQGPGHYMFFTLMNIIPTGLVSPNGINQSKVIYYFSSPVFYEGDPKSTFEWKEYLEKYDSEIPSYLDHTNKQVVLYSSKTQQLLKNEEECKSMMETTKNTIRDDYRGRTIKVEFIGH